MHFDHYDFYVKYPRYYQLNISQPQNDYTQMLKINKQVSKILKNVNLI